MPKLGSFLLVGVVALVPGCGTDWQVHRVTEVGIQQLSLDLSTCNATYNVRVEEAVDQVLLTVQQRRSGDPDAECRDEVIVDLAEPVEGRDVSVNGQRFEVREVSS